MPPTWAAPRDLISRSSRDLLKQCQSVLAGCGLSENESLLRSCQHVDRCWKTGVVRPADAVHARLPWIGPTYRRGGAVVIGMNAQTHAGLLDEFYVVDATRRQLAMGRQRFFGQAQRSPSSFHYRAAVIAGLLLDVARGQSPKLRCPEDAVEPLLATARVQAVQCAPAGSTRRTPKAAMLRRCPSLIAWPVVEVLAPCYVALLGTEVSAAFARYFDVHWTDSAALLRRGTATIAGQTAAVFTLRHPSDGYGMQSIRALQRHLVAHNP